jgi:hypothetical protein
MPSGVPPVGITQNERFFSSDAVIPGVIYQVTFINLKKVRIFGLL